MNDGDRMKFISNRYSGLNVLFIFLCMVSTIVLGDDSSLTLEGTVIEQGCTVDATDVNKTVNMGEWATKALQGQAGRKTALVPFSINLEECTVDTVSVSFSGKSAPELQGALSLDENSSATGIAVELTEKDGSSLPLTKSSSPVQVNPDGEAVFAFGARYTSISPTVTAGNADAEATFNIIYE